MNTWAGKRVLVTGATGFVGRRLVKVLSGVGAYVRIFTRGTVPTNERGVEAIVGDLTQPNTVTGLCRDVDTVFHLAAYTHTLQEGTLDVERGHRQLTTLGTGALLEEAARAAVKRFILISSVKAIGESTDGCVGETVEPRPTSAYGRAKLEAERNVFEVASRHRVHACVLRLPLVYGPGVKGNLWRMMQAIKHGRLPALPGTGNKRSMIHMDDVVQAALLTAVDPQANGQTYIVTDGCVYSTREVYTLLCRALGKSVPRWAIPASMILLVARVGDVINNIGGRRFVFDSDAAQKLLGSAWYSSQKIENELGFRPTRTLENSVGEMVAEYKRAKDSGLRTKDFSLR